MEIGLVGLGKMGYQLALNMLGNKHQIICYDRDHVQAAKISSYGARVVNSLQQLIDELTPPRLIWIMIPSGFPVNEVTKELNKLLDRGDMIIEAGNSHYRDSIQLADMCRDNGIDFYDVGTSGGMEGARYGACMMIGGNRDRFSFIEPLFQDLCQDGGYLFAGPSGSGHFLKMVHNGIEYAMMQGIGEGFELLNKSGFQFNYADVAGLWSRGSVIRGWLMELTERAFSKDAQLEQIRGVMQSSGEGKWTVETALELECSVPVIAMSLFMRYRSLDTEVFHGKVVAALRNEFGGHDVLR